MKRFSEYVDIKDKEEIGNASPELEMKPEMGSEAEPEVDETPEVSDDVIYRIMKVAWRKHRKTAEQFVKQLASEDPEIKSLLHGGHGDEPGPAQGPSDKDEVVPPEADGSPGMNAGGGEE